MIPRTVKIMWDEGIFINSSMLTWIYFLYTFILFFSFLVILAYNPIHSLLSLILVFFFSSLLLFSLGVDFLALYFLIIYAGAIAILFLFVSMMVNLGKKSGFKLYADNMRFEFLTIIVLFFNFVSMKSYFNLNLIFRFFRLLTKRFFSFHFLLNKYVLVYTIFFKKYFILFFLTGFLLLIAMCGIIFLLRNIKRRQRNDSGGI